MNKQSDPLVGFCIDLDSTPEIYRTNDSRFPGKIGIDFMPEIVPTIAPFNNIMEVKEWLINKFGEEQYRKWYPNPIVEQAEDGTILGFTN